MEKPDTKNTRFTLKDLPQKPSFEKGGVKLPVIGDKRFKLIEQRPQQQQLQHQQAARPVQVHPALTPGGGQGFHKLDIRVQIPQYKSPKVTIELGHMNEATRDFKPTAKPFTPLVSKAEERGMSRDR